MRTLLNVLLLTVVLLSGTPWVSAQSEKPAMPATLVNLNTATVEQLDALPGIGKATAQRILEFRQKNGAFKKIEELMNVKGVGEKSFLKLKPMITVAAKSDKAAGQQ